MNSLGFWSPPKRPKFANAACIWCQSQDFEPSLEHILPDALGCPPDFVLDHDVCRRCNNGLAHLDRALLKQFELLAFLGKVRRKNGKTPSMDSWSSLTGIYNDQGPELHLNAGPGTVEALGKTLKPVTSTKEFEGVSFEAMAGEATIQFSQRFGDDPKFIRAIYKVAMGVVVYWLGPNMAGTPEMAAAKKFVRKGRGNFGILLLTCANSRTHYFEPPHRADGTPYLIVSMRIFGLNFVIDFDPEQRGIARLVAHLTANGTANWTTLPVGHQIGR